MSVQILGPLRFECLGCGACCQGVKVELFTEEERARIRGFAEAFGHDDPVDDGWLKQDGGRCVFQDDDGLCAIHKKHGLEAKPTLCRTFPWVLVETESGMRAGINPSSFNTLKTWHSAPPYEDDTDDARRSDLDPHNQRVEQAIIAWCSHEGATIASVLGHLCASPDSAPELPPGFAARLIERLKHMRLDILLQAKDAGPAQKEALWPLVERIETLDPDDPPAWPVLTPNEDAFTLEATRRMVFLRLATRIPLVQGIPLLVLCGAVGLAWTDPDPERYGPALASWLRIIRAGSVWQSLTPDPATMQWLALGKRDV